MHLPAGAPVGGEEGASHNEVTAMSITVASPEVVRV